MLQIIPRSKDLLVNKERPLAQVTLNFKVSEPHPVVLERVVPVEASFRWRHCRNEQFDDPNQVHENAGVVKGPKKDQPINAR